MLKTKTDLLQIERELWRSGYRFVAGVDEVGRGPLAGPVVVAAVIFSPDVVIEGVADSKSISGSERERLFPLIQQQALAIGISAGSAKKIDQIGLAATLYSAMAMAIGRLKFSPDYVLLDGKYLPHKSTLESHTRTSFDCRAIIKGDSKSQSIAAASIIAKVLRDRLMSNLGEFYPEYRFGDNKGYGTAAHIEQLLSIGPTKHHRYSFAPLRQSMLRLNDAK